MKNKRNKNKREREYITVVFLFEFLEIPIHIVTRAPGIRERERNSLCVIIERKNMKPEG